MSKFSVRKPMTIFVLVIVIIALGIVSTTSMTPDLFPSIDLPYVMVMTSYPGATPEEVETAVTRPLEQNLATLENLKQIQSVSNANYSLVMLEFENDSNMDTAMVNTLQSVDLVSSMWDDSISSPNIMKMNPNMLPIAVAAVNMEGYSTERLSAFVEDTLVKELEGTTGIASVGTGGLIESKINVMIDEKKIEKLNKKLVGEVSPDLSGARDELNNGLEQLKAAEARLAQSRAQLDQNKDAAYDEMATISANLDAALAKTNAIELQIETLETQQAALKAQIAQGAYGSGYGVTKAELEAQLENVEAQLYALHMDSKTAEAQAEKLRQAYEKAQKGSYTTIDSFNGAYEELDKSQAQIEAQRKQLEDSLAQLDDAANVSLEQSGMDEMITMDMVASILQGQNFSMPAGYVQKDDVRYLVSVGDKLDEARDIKNLFLFEIEGLGKVYLKDVADVFVSDNSDAVYASINGKPGVLLSFSKQSNYPTATVSKNLEKKFTQLSEKHAGLHFSVLMDQGDYIYLIIHSILNSLAFGALFAIVILFLFLRDLKPTIITLLSIPISIVFALMLMYFSGVTLNMISLSGLAVAVGMLVDNSIVVIENIFRLRREGVPAAKAAVAGAKQVGAAITSSTLTTVCVFVPIVFVEGITRQLFTDMALTITYALLASLVIALTLVPSMASLMLRKEPKPEGKGAVRIKNAYRKLAAWNLRHKLVPLALAIFLLVFSVMASVSKGFIFMPDMATPQLSGTLTMDDEKATIEETSQTADRALALMEQVDGIETAGAMLASGGMGMITGETESNVVSLYLIMDEASDRSGNEIGEEIMEKCASLPCTVEIMTSSSMSSYTSALGGDGVGIEVFSDDTTTLQSAAEDIGKLLEQVDGVGEVDNGLAESEPEIHFIINKNKAMEKGLTVAQVYAQVSEALTNEKTATSMKMEGENYDVVVAEGEESDLTPAYIRNLKLTGKDGQGKEITVRLKDIAEIEETETLPSISRIDQNTYLKVTGEVEEGHNVTLVTEAAKEKLRTYNAPSGVRFEFDGENEMIIEAMLQLLKMMGLGVLLVYLIMVAQFQSLRSPFIIMFTIPLAFTGGLLTLLLFGKEISIIAMLGLIMLMGIIVNNGIVLVDYINQLRAGGMEKREAIVEAGVTRMRPVLMTSLTTILGLVVMAVGKTAGTDMMQPIALVCIGGLVYATILTLFIVPVIYDLLGGKHYKVVKKEDLDVSDIIVE